MIYANAEVDNLNVELRQKRKVLRQIELHLENAQEELAEAILKDIAVDVRKEVTKSKRILDEAYQEHEFAKNQLLEAEQSLEFATQKVKDAEASYLAVGGVLPKKETLSDKGVDKKSRQSPWISGSFYIFAIVILMTVIAVISANVPWYALAIVIIGGLIAIAIIGALQLRHDEALSEDNFIELMEKSLKRLPLLRGDENPNQTMSENQTTENSEV